MSKEQEPLGKSIRRFTASNLFQRAFGLLNTFIKPKLLSPDLFGLWNIFAVIAQYATYLHLGTRNAMFYRVPYHKGMDEPEKIAEVEADVYYGSLYPSIVAIVGILLYAAFRNLSVVERVGLVTTAVFVFLNWYYDFYYQYLTAHQDFILTSRMNFFKAAIAVVFNLVFVLLYGIYGLYLATLLTVVAAILFVRRGHELHIHKRFQARRFGELVKIGFPIMIYNMTNELVSSSDKIVVAMFLGTTQLGYYALTGLVFNFLMQIPGDIRDVVEPSLMRSFAAMSEGERLSAFFFKPLIYTGYLMPFLVGPAFFGIPVFIHFILPKYTQGILPAQIIVIGGYFFSLAYVARGIIVANNWQMPAVFVISLSVLLNVVLGISFIKSGWGIEGVSVGSSLSFLFLCICLTLFVKKKLGLNSAEWGRSFKELLWPFPVMCSLIGLIEYISKSLAVSEAVLFVPQIIIFLIFMLFFYNYAGKRSLYLKGVTIMGLLHNKLR